MAQFIHTDALPDPVSTNFEQLSLGGRILFKMNEEEKEIAVLTVMNAQTGLP